MLLGNALSSVADGATILLACAAIAAFLASRRVFLVATLAFIYATEVARVVGSRGGRRAPFAQVVPTLRTIPAFIGVVRQRLAGEEWPPARELETLRRLRSEWREGVVWTSATSTEAFAHAYARSAARCERSLLLRLGSPAVATDETALSRRMESLLLEAGTFYPRPSSALVDPDHVKLAQAFSTQLLVGPSHGVKTDFDEIFCSMRDELVGPPSLPFRKLANLQPGNWPTVDSKMGAALDARVQAVAKSRIADPLRSGDFNGTLLRLEGWQVEASDSGLRSRLHLRCARTNFATVLATNGGLHLSVDGLPASEVRPLCLDQFLDEPHASPAANAIAVHLALLSRDGYLVLVERSPTAEWAGGRLNTAANGLVELSARPGLPHGDIDSDGLVRVEFAAIREAHEELGEHLEIKPDHVRVRALALDIAPNEQITPYVVLEARVKLSLAEIADGHFYASSRAEGAFEVGEQIVGLPIMESAPEQVVSWLHRNRERISRPGLLSSLLTVGRRSPADRLLDAWRNPSPDECTATVLPTAP